tara:strand:- start:74 stop:190 length:117 start_codon:yes stop_codon:yes gene_type:complete
LKKKNSYYITYLNEEEEINETFSRLSKINSKIIGKEND